MRAILEGDNFFETDDIEMFVEISKAASLKRIADILEASEKRKLDYHSKNSSLSEHEIGDASEIIGKQMPGDFDPYAGSLVLQILEEHGFKLVRSHA